MSLFFFFFVRGVPKNKSEIQGDLCFIYHPNIALAETLLIKVAWLGLSFPSKSEHPKENRTACLGTEELQ